MVLVLATILQNVTLFLLRNEDDYTTRTWSNFMSKLIPPYDYTHFYGIYRLKDWQNNCLTVWQITNLPRDYYHPLPGVGPAADGLPVLPDLRREPSHQVQPQGEEAHIGQLHSRSCSGSLGSYCGAVLQKLRLAVILNSSKISYFQTLFSFFPL